MALDTGIHAGMTVLLAAGVGFTGASQAALFDSG
jgi:tetrahydromethanopterin S-methyltransferase subunit D